MNPIKDAIGAVVGCLFGLPLLLLATVTSPIWMLIFHFMHWRGEKREIQKMKEVGRFIEWTELMDLSGNGKNGTLIFEQAQKAGLRLWWTSDDVIALSPYSLPDEDEIDYLCIIPCPFMTWIRSKYTGAEGKALRTFRITQHAPGFAKAADFASTGFARVVPAVRWIRKQAEAPSDFQCDAPSQSDSMISAQVQRS
jgi:hypothetical protein